jgi:hypothetical protein
VLGLAIGPICLASCGPVVFPWMLAQSGGLRARSRQLSIFLAARLAGYMLFAGAAWFAGAAIPKAWRGPTWVLGIIQLLIAVALVVYVVVWPKARCATACQESGLVQIGVAPKGFGSGAVTLGFLTGVNLCPPFLVAGVRAAQLGSLSAALLFFTLFFTGTAVWFAPILALGFVQRSPAIISIARIAALLLACYYGFLGASTLIARILHV